MMLTPLSGVVHDYETCITPDGDSSLPTLVCFLLGYGLMVYCVATGLRNSTLSIESAYPLTSPPGSIVQDAAHGHEDTH